MEKVHTRHLYVYIALSVAITLATLGWSGSEKLHPREVKKATSETNTGSSSAIDMCTESSDEVFFVNCAGFL